jgi:hypothetical protein
LVTARGYQLVNLHTGDFLMSDQATESAAPSAEAKAESTAATGPIRFPLAIYKPSTQQRRFALIAASVAFAAALGGLIGSLSTYGLASPKTNDAAEPARNLQAALTQVTKDIATLKASVDASNRAAASQMAKFTERFDRSERAQAEPAAKITALNESIARLEKRIIANAEAARDITGSVPERTATAAAGPAPTSTAAKDQAKPIIVEGWVLREIYRGRALVESRTGLYEVSRGGNLPGIGKVETITQQNGRWVVVTPKGLIVSMR